MVDERIEAAGRVIENPISGERIVIRRSAAQTRGELLSFDLHLPHRGPVPAAHVHPDQEERFTVLEGRMRFRLGRRLVVALLAPLAWVARRRPRWAHTTAASPAGTLHSPGGSHAAPGQ